jgi:hypothetical protein
MFLAIQKNSRPAREKDNVKSIGENQRVELLYTPKHCPTFKLLAQLHQAEMFPRQKKQFFATKSSKINLVKEINSKSKTPSNVKVHID